MYHIIDPNDTHAFDSIASMVLTNGVGYLASHQPPTEVPRKHWAQNISPKWYASGEEMARAINGGLVQGAAPGMIMIDELNGNSRQKINECAVFMKAQYPQWEGRWGCYIVDGYGVSYRNLDPAISSLLVANATVAPEFYPKQSWYCNAHPTNIGVRDQWLSDYFYGEGPRNYGRCCTRLARFHWLIERRRELKSKSSVCPLFGVSDQFMDGTQPVRFLDRMFFVWVTRTGYAGLLHDSNGGAGSWKWQRPFMSNSSRDLAFSRSWEWYCKDKKRTSRMGRVAC
jgi:hypothetical protein